MLTHYWISIRTGDPLQVSKRLAYLVATGLSLMAVFICWSVSSPLGSAPDDAFHAAQIWCSKGLSSEFCKVISVNGDRLTVEVPKISHDCFWNPQLADASCVNSGPNRQPQQVSYGENDYPGGQYKVLSLFVGKNAINSLLWMRVFNGFIATIISISILVLASSKLRFAFVASWTAVLSPHGLFFISSINPSGWSFLSVSTSWIFLTIVMGNNWGERAGKIKGSFACAFLTLTFLIGISARWDTWVFLFSTYCVSILIANAQKGWFKLSHLAFIGSAILISVLVISRFNPKIGYFSVLSPLQNQTGLSFGQYLIYLLVHLIEFPAGVFGSDWGWGGLGGLYPSTPPVVGIVGLSIAIATLIFATRKINKNQTIASCLIALLIFGSTWQQQNVGRFYIGDMVAPRYLMGLVSVFIAVALFTSTSDEQFFNIRHFRIGALIALSLTHSLALYSNMDRFITFGLGSTGYFKGFSQEGRWWWDTSVSPYFVWTLGSISFIVFLFSTWQTCLPAPTSKGDLI